MAGVVVFAPHPDDEVIGCGGSIAAHEAAGRRCWLVYLTSGEQGVPAAEPAEAQRMREREAVRAAGALGVPGERLEFLRFPDGGVDPADHGQFLTVLAVLRRLRPSTVYLPHRDDGSFDHRQASALVWRALEMSGSRNFAQAGAAHWVSTVLGYEVWSPLKSPALLQDIDPQVKERALACYRSQAKGAGQAELGGPGGLALSRLRGAMTTGGHREAFAVLRCAGVAW